MTKYRPSMVVVTTTLAPVASVESGSEVTKTSPSGRATMISGDGVFGFDLDPDLSHGLSGGFSRFRYFSVPTLRFGWIGYDICCGYCGLCFRFRSRFV